MGTEERPGTTVTLEPVLVLALETGIEVRPGLNIVSVVTIELDNTILVDAIDEVVCEVLLETGIELKPGVKLSKVAVLEAVGKIVEFD